MSKTRKQNLAPTKQGFSTPAAPEDEGALLFRIRNGDKEAFSELLSRYEGMLRKLSYSFAGISPCDVEDLYQDGLIGFYKASLFYDPNDKSASSFSTFAYLCAKRNMLSAIKKLSRTPETLSMQDLEIEPVSTFGVPEQDLIDHENLDAIFKSFDKVLSDYESDVLKQTLAGLTVGKIASRAGKSERSVSNALFRAKSKLSVLYRR